MKNRPFPQRLGFAVGGILQALKSERSMRVHAVALTGLLIVLIITRPAPLWWAALLSSAGLVLMAELFNTALEALADRLHPESHPEIARAKDCAAGAVLLASLVALGVAVAFLVQLLR